MSRLRLYVSVLLCIGGALGAGSSVKQTTSSEILTCPYRTVNYLTHTLAQQCLPSNRLGSYGSIEHNVTTTPSQTASSDRTDESTQTRQQTSFPPSPSLPSTVPPTSSLAPTTSPLTTSIESVTTIITTSNPVDGSIALLPDAADDESPLESGNFLSFEDWKKQNLKRVGQSEQLGRNIRAEQKEPRKRQDNVHNTLDSLGDDAEIELDFSGLVPGGLETSNEQTREHASSEHSSSQPEGSSTELKTHAGSKEAGTTSKERFNYASYDCAANVLKSNVEAKSANQVLRENKDLYMLNKCSAKNKFIILELCEDISIDTIVLANFEFFSSSFRTFRVSVSDRYPVKVEKWKTLGTFEARNTREVQAFRVDNPVIWASYVRIEFLTHYGQEFYCPVSLIRVHGTTMMEEYKHDLDMGTEEDEDEVENMISDGADATVVLTDIDESPVLEDVGSVAGSKIREQQDHLHEDAQLVSLPHKADNESRIESSTSPNEVSAVQELLLSGDLDPCSSSCEYQHPHQTILVGSSAKTSNFISTSTPEESSVEPESGTMSGPGDGRHSTIVEPTSKSNNVPAASSIEAHEGQAKVNDMEKHPTSKGSDSPKTNSTARDISRTSTSRQSSSGTQSQPASPTMQESFFKSVQKRLQMLESNSSLSLQYIEEQSRSLRDAFRKVEQRQLSKTSTFLEHLNQTVLHELREFRQQYDQLWQSTVIELELQRERYQRESQAMHARLGVLADELIFQRRVSILQMILILVCLGLVLFSRGAVNNYLELPLVQSVLSRSPSSRWTNLSGDSRQSTPAMARTRSAHQLGIKPGILKGHHRSGSDESNHELLSASEMYSPPTPVSFDGYSDAEIVKVEPKTEDPEFDPGSIQRPSTSPPVLPSVEDPITPRSGNYGVDTSIDGRLFTPDSVTEKTQIPAVKIETPTPPSRHLTWDLPD